MMVQRIPTPLVEDKVSRSCGFFVRQRPPTSTHFSPLRTQLPHAFWQSCLFAKLTPVAVLLLLRTFLPLDPGRFHVAFLALVPGFLEVPPPLSIPPHPIITVTINIGSRNIFCSQSWANKLPVSASRLYPSNSLFNSRPGRLFRYLDNLGVV